MFSLERDVSAATVTDRYPRSERFAKGIPHLTEGISTAYEAMLNVLTEGETSLRMVHCQRPDVLLPATLQEEGSELITFLVEDAENEQLHGEIRRVLHLVRPPLVVVMNAAGDPCMGDRFFRAMREDMPDPPLRGSPSYLHYIHGVPLRALDDDDNCATTVQEIIERFISIRKRIENAS